MAKNLHEFMFVDVLDEPDHVVCPGFTEDVLPVGLYGSLTDAQVAGDLLIAEFFLDKAYHFQFTKGKGSILLGSLQLFHTIRLIFS